MKLVLPSLGIRAPDPESDPHLNPDQTHSIDQDDIALDLKRAGIVTAMAALTVVALDQVAKAVIVAWIGPDQADSRWELAGRLLAFEYVENTGAAFGILAGRVWLLSVMALLVGGGFLFAFRDQLPHSRLLQLGVGLILGGAIGNLIDRIRLGYVVDFIAAGTWGDEQRKNARILSNVGAAVVIEQTDASPERLRQEILELIADPARRTAMSNSARTTSRPNAAANLVDELLKLVR